MSLSKNETRFWMCMVHGEGPPKMRHKSKPEANEEAKRLAAANHGKSVYVLEMSHYFKVEMPEPLCFLPAPVSNE